MRTALLVVLVFLLFGSSLVALATGLNDMTLVVTLGQSLAAAADLVLGVAGIVATGGLLFRRAWIRIPLGVWVLSATLAAGVATVSWGGSGVAQGLLSAAGALVVTGVVAWALVRLTAAVPATKSTEPPSADASPQE